MNNLRVYFNGRALCGSDYFRPLQNNLGTKAINNRLNYLIASIETLKAIKPHLNDGIIEYYIEYYSGYKLTSIKKLK